MARDKEGSVVDFTRGSELWLYQIRMFFEGLLSAFLIASVIGLIIGGSYVFLKIDRQDFGYTYSHQMAKLRSSRSEEAGKDLMELKINGQLASMPVNDVIAYTLPKAQRATAVIKNGFVIGGLLGIGLTIMLSLYWTYFGKRAMKDERIRGASLVEGEQLKQMLADRDDASCYNISGVPMRKGSETLNILIAGAPGSGKSQQFLALFRQIRAQKKRAIVYDPSGEFTQALYREGIDVVLNPLDARSPNWNPWQEITEEYHYENMASGLIPLTNKGDPFWSQAGRMLLKDVYKVLAKEDRRSNAALYDAIATSDLSELYALLQGRAGATFVDPKTEKTGLNLKMTIQNQLESFSYLHDDGKPFSIRKWVAEESDGWLFISTREAVREVLKPVLSLWINVVIKAVMDLPPVHRERLWLAIDELPTLQRLDELSLSLTNTRKYGLCHILGVQDFSQIYDLYGQDTAKTIISACQTKLLLRVTDSAAAKLMSELMGEAEIDEKELSRTMGVNSARDGVSFYGRRNIRAIVMTSEILNLPDMQGYLVIPGDYPVAKVKYQYVPTEKIAEAFVPRKSSVVTSDQQPVLENLENSEVVDSSERPDNRSEDSWKIF